MSSRHHDSMSVVHWRRLRPLIIALHVVVGVSHQSDDKLLAAHDCGNTEHERFLALCDAPLAKAKQSCVIAGTVYLDPDWYRCSWVADGTLEFLPDAWLGCANRTDRPSSTDTCELDLSFASGIFLRQRSRIKARTIRLSSLQGRVVVEAGARVDADAGGICGQDRITAHQPFNTQTGYGFGGAGHGGDGARARAAACCDAAHLLPGSIIGTLSA